MYWKLFNWWIHDTPLQGRTRNWIPDVLMLLLEFSNLEPISSLSAVYLSSHISAIAKKKNSKVNTLSQFQVLFCLGDLLRWQVQPIEMLYHLEQHLPSKHLDYKGKLKSGFNNFEGKITCFDFLHLNPALSIIVKLHFPKRMASESIVIHFDHWNMYSFPF